MSQPIVTLTTVSENSTTATQTIAGSVAGSAVVTGQLVSISDNGVVVGTTALASGDTFSNAITLANLGANSLTASLTDAGGNTGTSAALVDTLTAATVTGAAGSSVFTNAPSAPPGQGEFDTFVDQSVPISALTAIAGGAGGTEPLNNSGAGGPAAATSVDDTLNSTGATC